MAEPNGNITPAELEMTRKKPRELSISLGYRFVRFGKTLFGKQRILKFLLNRSWLSWRLAFELSSEVYPNDLFVHTRAVSEDLLRRWIPENGSLIDIGCGFGEWCRIGSKYAYNVVGVDFDENRIRMARELTEMPNVEFKVGNVLSDLSYPIFDVALLSHVLEHVDDAGGFLQGLKNFAKILIVEVPDFENDPLNWVRMKQGCRFYTDGDHVREYTLAALVTQLENSGWALIESDRRNGSMFVVAKVR